MKSRRGLSTVVGAVFFVIAAASTITYISYSMDMVDTFANTVMVKQTEQEERISEVIEVTHVKIDNSKFNLTIQNSGKVPVNIKRMWVSNQSATDWVYKYDINEQIAPSAKKYNIGQNIALTAKDTIPYSIKLVTERGTVVQVNVNSFSQEPVFMLLTPTPSKIPTGFTTTLVYQVVNNMTEGNVLVNLTPQITKTGTALATLESGPTPPSWPVLKQGEVATFRWDYTLTGNDADSAIFNATLQNAKTGNFALTTGEIKVVAESAKSSEAFESTLADVSIGLGVTALPDNIILLHKETDLTPSGSYQMFSADADGGTNGLLLQLDQTSPNFFTANNTVTINVPSGEWTTSLNLQSEAMPASLKGEGEDLIFHFEDGIGTAPDNSEGDANRDLEACGSLNWNKKVVANSDDALEYTGVGGGSAGDVKDDKNDVMIPHDGNKETINGMRFTGVTIPNGATITNAYVQFTASSSDSGTVNLKVYGQDIDDAPTFVETDNNISARPKTSASVSWTPASWTNNDRTSAQQTPNIKSIIQEIINRGGWASGNDIVIIIENDGTSGSNTRDADSHDSSSSNAAELFITYDLAAAAEIPQWQAGTGPHGSGSFYFNGVNECFRSKQDVSSANGNHIYSEADTTALWFKTNGAVTAEQYLVYWSGDDGCTNCNSYRIALDSIGRIVFEFETQTGGGDKTTCQSTQEYDDDKWYHLVAVREGSGTSDECTLHISDLSVVNPKSESPYPINQDNSYASNFVDADGKFYVGANDGENGKWFKGWIDDLIHWNDKALTSTEAADLSKVNYGTAAHKLDFYYDITDETGNFVSNIDTSLAVEVPFQDPKGQGDNTDSAYGVFNHTVSIGATTIVNPQRANFSIYYVPSTASWEALELDMKIDDEGFSPYSSYIQIPTPDYTFPGYFTYDPSADDLEFDVANTGTSGHWYSYYLTRIVFKSATNSSDSYAGPINKVNNTKVDHQADSIYIPVNGTGNLEFFEPGNPPDPKGCGGGCITDGRYKMTIYIQGYDDLGQMFVKQKYLGIVNVQD